MTLEATTSRPPPHPGRFRPRLRLPSATAMAAAALLMAVALGWVIAEPVGKGPVLVAFSRNHGLDVGDLPAVALVAVAAVISRPRRRLNQ